VERRAVVGEQQCSQRPPDLDGACEIRPADPRAVVQEPAVAQPALQVARLAQELDLLEAAVRVEGVHELLHERQLARRGITGTALLGVDNHRLNMIGYVTGKTKTTVTNRRRRRC